jgi:hypothetical protein
MFGTCVGAPVPGVCGGVGGRCCANTDSASISAVLENNNFFIVAIRIFKKMPIKIGLFGYQQSNRETDWMNGEVFIKIGKIQSKNIVRKFVALNKIPILYPL